MNTRWGLLAIALTIIALGSAAVLVIIPAPKTPFETATTTPDNNTADIAVNPLEVASTTITITGRARGTWYFEASFPVQVLDQNGKTIAQGPAQAQGDWMTTAFVPFSITLSYPKQPAGSHGTVILKNDNPSGDPAKEKSFEIPVVFY